MVCRCCTAAAHPKASLCFDATHYDFIQSIKPLKFQPKGKYIACTYAVHILENEPEQQVPQRVQVVSNEAMQMHGLISQLSLTFKAFS